MANINWEEFSVDAKVEGVSKAQRALANFPNSQGLLEGIGSSIEFISELLML